MFVHALNPYGFRTHRRVNEGNVDINRNFLTAKQFEFVKARDVNYARHVDFEAAMNPTAMPFRIMFLNDLYMALLAVKSIALNGYLSVKRGQYIRNIRQFPC